MGEWLDRCGEAIYGTRPTPHYNDGNIWFTVSKDGKTGYAVYPLADGEALPAELSWSGLLPEGKVTLLNTGKRLKASIKDGRATVRIPKGTAAEPLALRFIIR